VTFNKDYHRSAPKSRVRLVVLFILQHSSAISEQDVLACCKGGSRRSHLEFGGVSGTVAAEGGYGFGVYLDSFRSRARFTSSARSRARWRLGALASSRAISCHGLRVWGTDHRAWHRTEQKSWPPSVRERTELVVAGSQPLRRHRLRPRLLLQILGRTLWVDGFSVMVGFALVDGNRLTANGARENKRCVIRHGCPPL